MTADMKPVFQNLFKEIFSSLRPFDLFVPNFGYKVENHAIFKQAPEEVTRGRRLSQIAWDDALEAFEYLGAETRKQNPDSPGEFAVHIYRQLLEFRHPAKEFSFTDAKEQLDARIAEKLESGATPPATPTFLKLFYEKVDITEYNDLKIKWMTVLANMALAFQTESAIAAQVTAAQLGKATTNELDIWFEKVKREAAAAATSAPAETTDDPAARETQTRRAIEEKLEEKDPWFKLRTKLAEAGLPEDVRQQADDKLRRLERLPESSTERGPIETYLEWLAETPWKKSGELNRDLSLSQKMMDEDHYGLEKVKEKILDIIAVNNRNGNSKPTIIIIDGPPGVGKTSIGRSIARATGREFARLSMGGVRDEAEIRGHRRTYSGATPGQIVQSLKKVGVNNPVFQLDEMDKLSSENRGGGPSAALLEVLDPEQNSTFRDHYLNLDLDLSKVLFICTTNNVGALPAELQDRAEIIRIPGYIEKEKFEIAKRYLVPKQMADKVLTADNLTIGDDALLRVIRQYTHEAGVRDLERKIGTICAKTARKLIDEPGRKFHVGENDLTEILGEPQVTHDELLEEDEIGVANGLAWTARGGEILQVEALAQPGKDFTVEKTGNLGDVMKESVTVATPVAKQLALEFGMKAEDLDKLKINVHAPSGAIPKDGPSAGVTTALAITSAVTKIPIRRDVVMTGELTLTGRVIPIGGLAQKLEAATRAGATTVIIPVGNIKDLKEVPLEIRNNLEIVSVENAREASPEGKLKIVPVKNVREAVKVAFTRATLPDALPGNIVFPAVPDSHTPAHVPA